MTGRGGGTDREFKIEMRHGSRGNVAFVDSHAESMNLIDLGYEVREDGLAVPVLDPLSGTYSASNALWSGNARDQIADDHRP